MIKDIVVVEAQFWDDLEKKVEKFSWSHPDYISHGPVMLTVADHVIVWYHQFFVLLDDKWKNGDV